MTQNSCPRVIRLSFEAVIAKYLSHSLYTVMNQVTLEFLFHCFVYGEAMISSLFCWPNCLEILPI